VKACALLLLAHIPLATAQRALPVESIKLPPGFSIQLIARVPGAREMTWGAQGTLFVASRSEGKAYAVRLASDDDPQKARVTEVVSGLRSPAGVAFRDGALYVSGIDRIVRVADAERNLEGAAKAEVVSDRFPKDAWHGWKFIAFGPDGKLYVPVGAPCNVCEPDMERYANVMRMNPDGTGLEVFARGVRNTVGFDWDPQTKEMWFTDNGRDNLGDDAPPDELNHAPRAGLHFGYPYCHGGTIADPEFGAKHACAEFVPPAQRLGPHVAALGMRFYAGKQFPDRYRSGIFIAEHGSWNRSTKIGYRVTFVRVENGRATSYETFAQGWLEGDAVWVRPSDVLVGPDGSLLVSDDYAGAIYRIRYRG